MNRRKLLIRTVSTGFSATVFAAAGWLMGVRGLTMATGGSPGPWQQTWYDTCGGDLLDCSCVNYSNWSCTYDGNCQGPGSNAFCRFYEYQYNQCCGTPSTICMFEWRYWTCASCNFC